jgi:hypothetical protein
VVVTHKAHHNLALWKNAAKRRLSFCQRRSHILFASDSFLLSLLHYYDITKAIVKTPFRKTRCSMHQKNQSISQSVNQWGAIPCGNLPDDGEFLEHFGILDTGCLCQDSLKTTVEKQRSIARGKRKTHIHSQVWEEEEEEERKRKKEQNSQQRQAAEERSPERRGE